MELKASKTEKNLLAAFAGESMARNRYNLYAKKAREEGFEYVAKILNLTADNEFAHAEEIFKLLKSMGNTAENLNNAVYVENEEWSHIYKESAMVAKEEGFAEIANFFEQLQKVEKEHEQRFAALQKQVEAGTMFKDLPTTTWICQNCGHEHQGAEPPEKCPLCKYPKAYFARKTSGDQ